MSARVSGVTETPSRWAIWIDALDRRDGLGWAEQMGVLAVVALAIFSRLPVLLTNAQFYAEDGKVWYAQAYQMGWLHSLMLPEGGYLNTAQRLGAGVSLLVPFRWAPLTMAIFGLLMQCLPVALLLSSRCRNWGPLSLRCMFAFFYVICPNAREIHIVLTNCQWHLALAAVLLGFGCAPRSRGGRVLDVMLFAVVSVSGPFGLVLVLLLALFWTFARDRWTWVQVGILAAGGMVQARMIATSSDRIRGELGAGWELFLRLLGGNVIGNALAGGGEFGRYGPLPLVALAGLLGIAVYGYVLRYGNVALKLLLVFSGVLLAASLKSPLLGGPGAPPLWRIMLVASTLRYWFFPMIAFLWGLAWMMRSAKQRWLRVVAACALLCTTAGVIARWEFTPYADEHFATSVERLRQAEPGTDVTIPILPDGVWTMTLTKRGPRGSIGR